jgi:hypothetical protein
MHLGHNTREQTYQGMFYELGVGYLYSISGCDTYRSRERSEEGDQHIVEQDHSCLTTGLSGRDYTIPPEILMNAQNL